MNSQKMFWKYEPISKAKLRRQHKIVYDLEMVLWDELLVFIQIFVLCAKRSA